MKVFLGWLNSLATIKKVLLGLGALLVIGITTGGHTSTTLNSSKTGNAPLKPAQTQKANQPNIKTSTVEKRNVTETQSIPFTTTTVDDSTLAKGTIKVAIQGVNGAKTLTYEITYTNGNQTDKKLISAEVTMQPINQVTAIGTYEAPTCPNGTYINSDGNTVCSPYTSAGPPAGATARCADGTYSFSQLRSGTCSYHGGVAEWL